jgi:hypothetical protein
MTEHKHAEIIKAWADGAKIQKFSGRKQVWEDADTPTWNVDAQYRVKVNSDHTIEINANFLNGEFFIDIDARFPNLLLIFDGETKQLKNAQLIKWKGKK